MGASSVNDKALRQNCHVVSATELVHWHLMAGIVLETRQFAATLQFSYKVQIGENGISALLRQAHLA